MTAMTKEAIEAKKAYTKQYQKEHKERLNEYHKEWYRKNRDRVKQYNINYWNKKADELEQCSDTQNIYKQFIKHMCILNDMSSISNKALAEAFNRWNNSSLTVTKFSLQFDATAQLMGLTKSRNKHGIVWHGLRLKEAND